MKMRLKVNDGLLLWTLADTVRYFIRQFLA